MRIRYYIDPVTGLPHIYNHGISEEKLRQFFLVRYKTYAVATILELP